jgi:hypothetical protein
MIALNTHGCISRERKVMFLNILRSLKIWLKSKLAGTSKFSDQMKGESTDLGLSSNTSKKMELYNSSRYDTLLSKMEWQKGKIEPWLNVHEV